MGGGECVPLIVYGVHETRFTIKKKQDEGGRQIILEGGEVRERGGG